MVKPSSYLWIKQVLSLTRKNQGLLFGLATYIQWGFLSLFWKFLAGVSAYNTFSWRIVFTVVTMLTYALVAKQNTRFKGELVELWQDKKALLRMLLASFLIAANWLFISMLWVMVKRRRLAWAITLCLLFLSCLPSFFFVNH